ncbi:MAG: hypothetical protein R3D71_05995 [Rickettsiales bacterium]
MAEEESGKKVFNDVKDSFGKYIVAPISQFGLGGFVFDGEEETVLNLHADITDHFTEGNFSVQDHIALKPKIVKLNTFVGELVHHNEIQGSGDTQRIARKLTTINSYLPSLSAASNQIKKILDKNDKEQIFNNVTDNALNIYGMIKNIAPPLPKQQVAYQYLKALYEQKIPVSLQTPFEFCSSMAIEDITAIQDEHSRYISNFIITLKEIRTVSFNILSFSKILDGRAGQQATKEVDRGVIKGIESTVNSIVESFK